MNEPAWKPSRGQVALLEFPGESDNRLTGIVVGGPSESGDTGPVTIDLGSSPPPLEPTEVRASFFAPDALYRVRATASRHEEQQGVVDLTVHEIDRVQRREQPRAKVALPVVLSAFDGPGEFASVVGETVDLGPGGCRVRTQKPWGTASDPTVSLQLPSGDTLVARAQLLQVQSVAGHHEHRLSFKTLEDVDYDRLLALAEDDAG